MTLLTSVLHFKRYPSSQCSLVVATTVKRVLHLLQCKDRYTSIRLQQVGQTMSKNNKILSSVCIYDTTKNVRWHVFKTPIAFSTV